MQKGQSSIHAIHTLCGVHPTRLLRFIANAYYYYYTEMVHAKIFIYAKDTVGSATTGSYICLAALGRRARP
jgi:hypothetical protein